MKRSLLSLSLLLGTIAAGYLIYESGVLRTIVIEEPGGKESLLESSGLSSQEDVQRRASASSQTRGTETQSWAVFVSSTWPSVLGFAAGVFAFANAVHVPALLIGGLKFLFAKAAGAVWVAARLVTGSGRKALSLVLSLYNFILSLRGKELVGNAPESPVRRPASSFRSGPGNQNGGAEQSSSGQSAVSHPPSSSDADGPEPSEPDSSKPDSSEPNSSDSGSSDRSGQASEEKIGAGPPGKTNGSAKRPERDRVFQPWWYERPPAQRPADPDSAEKTPGRPCDTLEEAIEALQNREPDLRACVLEFRLGKGGKREFLARHECPPQ